jgi:O-antigen/teichoic acid export membrane protein
MRSDVLSVPRQALIYVSGQVLSRGAAFLLIPLYTRFLTQEEYGILGIAAAVAGVLAILLGLGLEEAVVRFAFDRDPEAQRVCRGTLWIFLVASGVAFGLVADLAGPRVAHAVFPTVPFRPFLRLVLWTNVLALAGTIPLALFRARRQALRYVCWSAGSFLVTIALTLALVVGRGLGVRGALAAPLVSAAAFALPYTVMTLKEVRLTVRRADLRAALAFSLPLVPHSLAGWALNLSDRILLQRFVPLDEISVYYLGYQVGLLLSILGIAANNAWRPFFYRTMTEEGAGAPRTLSRLSTYGIAAVVFAGMVLAVFSRELVALLAPSGYGRAAGVAGPVILAFTFQGIYFFAVNGLFAARRTRPLPLVTAVAAAANIGLNLWLIPRFGIMAAAWSTAIGFAILLAGAWALSQAAYPIPYEIRRLILLGAVGLAAAVAAHVLPLDGGPAIAAKIAIVAAAPLALAAAGFVPQRDRALLRSYALAIVRPPREESP